MDCFCGSGGFLYIADKLDRRWFGIDASDEAIKITTSRFKDNGNLFSKKEITTLIL
jgi:adenine-specific DNA-methyltransferase